MLQRLTSLAAGFLLAAVLTEALLHALPYSTGYGIQGVNAAQPIPMGAPHDPYTYSRDWSFHFANSGSLNNVGFRSATDYVLNPEALVVIGNSFVQADAVPVDHRMTERIGALLKRPAYAIGVDGFGLPDYLAASSWAVSQFHPPSVLVLLTTEDLVRSCRQISGQHGLRYAADGTLSLALYERPTPTAVKSAVNESSLFRYLFDNLHVPANWAKGWRREDHGPSTALAAPKATPATEPDPAANGGTEEPVAAPARTVAARPAKAESAETPATAASAAGPPRKADCSTKAFQELATRFLLDGFRQLQQTNNTQVVFILSADYFQRRTVRGAFRDVDAFATEAAKEGFAVVSLVEPFAVAGRDGQPLDLMPIDRHWNALANEVAARAVANYMLERPAQPPVPMPQR
jgi:hypothetical protein